MKKLNTEEYIRRAKEVHGDKYDYSETSYKSSRDPVKIICKEHGPFLKNSKSHLYGYACDYCSGKELTFADFVESSARDIIKDIYCVNSGINLIRIPYYTKSADIKDIFSNALK